MAEYTGTFETGVSGNTITVGDAGSATAWDTINLVGSLQYSNVEKYGALSARQISDGSGQASYLAWDSSTLGSSLTTHYGRIYMFLPSGLADFFYPVRGFDGGTRCFEILVWTDQKLHLRDTLGNDKAESTVALSTNQWVRMEWKVVNSTTAGVVECKIFNDADSNTPDETVTSTGSFSTLTKTDLLRFLFADGNAAISSTYYFDNILVNDTGYPGPAGGATTFIRTPKRLVGPTLVTNSPVTGYTVPASYVTRIRHVHISNPSGSPVDMTLSIGTDAAATRLLDGKPIAADSVYEMACDEVLAAGEIVQISASSTNVLTITISGEEWVSA